MTLGSITETIAWWEDNPFAESAFWELWCLELDGVKLTPSQQDFLSHYTDYQGEQSNDGLPF